MITRRALKNSIVVLTTVRTTVFVDGLFNFCLGLSLALQDLFLIHQKLCIYYFPNDDPFWLFWINQLWLSFLVGTWSPNLKVWSIDLSSVRRRLSFAKQIFRNLNCFDSKQIWWSDSTTLFIWVSLQLISHVDDFGLAIVSDKTLTGCWSALILYFFLFFLFNKGWTEWNSLLCFTTFLLLRFV